MAIKRMAWCLVAILGCVSVLVVKCCNQENRECPTSRETSEYVSPVVAPCRVSLDQLNYIALLNSQTSNTSSLQCVYTSTVQVITSEFVELFESPLLAFKSTSSLPKVYALGQALVSLLLMDPEKEGIDISPVIPVYTWLVRGLRKETGLSSRLCAIGLEKQLVEGACGPFKSIHLFENDLAMSVYRSYLTDTIGYVKNSITQLQGVKLYGKTDSAANEAIPELLQALDQIQCNLDDSTQLKQKAYSLPSIVICTPDSIKKQVLVEYIDLLLSDVDLYFMKQAKRENMQVE